MTTELCAYSLDACVVAKRMGVTRVELCASPFEGGTTPSAAAITLARRCEGLQLSVMIRPRGGDFLYTPTEFDQMLADVRFARQCGADGVVFGMLTTDGEVDEDRCAELVAAAGPMQTTFHRAFDMARNLQRALEAVIRTGCTRILTSGGRNTALEGIELLRQLVAQADRRIELMAGSGITPQNVARITATGVDAVHFSARAVHESAMKFHNPTVHMGGSAEVGEYELIGVDESMVCQILKQLAG